MSKGKSKLELAQEQAQRAVKRTNRKIREMGEHTGRIYHDLTALQQLFDAIRNVPDKTRLEYEKLNQTRLEWKQQVDKIEADSRKDRIKNTGAGAVGAGAGVAVAALGPTVAMGVATTFGVASTGTAISALSGAAATNAALAWLGGGALAAGGGMAAGSAFLAMAGPVGWAIAGISLAGSGLLLLKGKSDKERLENIFTLISKRDTASYKLAIVEMSERIARITEECPKLSDAIGEIKSFGTDYDRMTEKQQYALGSYVNRMNASTQLLVDPILGLQPKYTEEDFNRYGKYHDAQYPPANKSMKFVNFYEDDKPILLYLANLLYKIEMDDKDRDLLWKHLRKNKEFMSSFGQEKGSHDSYIISVTAELLEYKEELENNNS